MLKQVLRQLFKNGDFVLVSIGGNAGKNIYRAIKCAVFKILMISQRAYLESYLTKNIYRVKDTLIIRRSHHQDALDFPVVDRPDIQRRIEASMNMAPTLATVSIRTQLALVCMSPEQVVVGC